MLSNLDYKIKKIQQTIEILIRLKEIEKEKLQKLIEKRKTMRNGKEE